MQDINRHTSGFNINTHTHTDVWSSPVTKWVKCPVLLLQQLRSLLWCRSDSWTRNFHMHGCNPPQRTIDINVYMHIHTYIMYIPFSWFLKTFLHQKQKNKNKQKKKTLGHSEETDFKVSAEKVQEDELGISHHARKLENSKIIRNMPKDTEPGLHQPNFGQFEQQNK